MTMSSENTDKMTKNDQLIRQLEYYMGDFNLLTDKFFKTVIAENDGWVPIDNFLKCKRVADITKEADDLITAIKEGKTDLLEVDADNKCIRRLVTRPLPTCTFPEFLQQNIGKSVYAKGFPKTATFNEVFDYFEKIGQTVNIYMRQFPVERNKQQNGDKKKNAFKGTCYAIYANEEDAKRFLTAEETAEFKAGMPMERLTKAEHVEQSDKERKKAAEDRQQLQAKKRKMDMSRAEAAMTKGAMLEIKPVTREIVTKIQKSLEAASNVNHEAEETKTETANGDQEKTAETNGNNKSQSPGMEDRKLAQHIRDCVNSLLKTTEEGEKTAEDKATAGEGGEVKATNAAKKSDTNGLTIAWVENDMNNSVSILRFKEENGAQKAMDLMNNKGGLKLVKDGEDAMEMRVLGGEEEMTQWCNLLSRSKKNHQGGGGGPARKRFRR